MIFMEFYLPVIWGLLIAVAIGFYVVLDGFDLGVGILFPFHRGEAARDQMMASIAPYWDGNETWLILGGGALWIAFPQAYAVVMPGVYLPVVIMLLALVLRGVAFEFRHVSKPHHGRWEVAFAGGSTVAAFCQGLVLGTVIEGLPMQNGAFAGGPFEFVRPFAFLCGLGVVAGYALLGAGWLMVKTEGPVHETARHLARPLFGALIAFIAVVSLWTPLAMPWIGARWFSVPMIWYLWPVPLLTLLIAWIALRGIERDKGLRTFVCVLALFLLCFAGLGISTFPYLVPPTLDVWQAAASPDSQMFMLIGAVAMLPIILAYTAFVYWTFRGKVLPGQSYH
ncbi:cytochrome d ubiquinol oxidase subunit II [Pseudoxanthobacter sp.]|uniref:cytochrome d ubiquinol oxidase subunit II n=1 Tax=Pseudoxanthobacter sp. TaxID=1925742 RepID=UPI002FDF963D